MRLATLVAGSMDYGSPTAYGYDGPRSLPFTPGIPNRISYTQGARKAILKENKEGIDNMARIMKKQERSWGGRKARGGNEYSVGGEKKDGGERCERNRRRGRSI